MKLDPNLEDTGKIVNDITSAIDRVDDFADDAEKTLAIELSTTQIPIVNIDDMRRLVFNKEGKADQAEEEDVDAERLRDIGKNPAWVSLQIRKAGNGKVVSELVNKTARGERTGFKNTFAGGLLPSAFCTEE